MFKSSLCFFSLLLTSSSALALDIAGKCTAKPECEALGYSKNIDVNCHQVIKCPFDLNYKMCLDCKNNSGDDPEPEPQPSTCPEGKITSEECEARNGVFKDGSIMGNCGECLTCEEGELVKRGTFSSVPEGYGYVALNYNGSATNSDICIMPCECVGGTLLTKSNHTLTRPDPGSSVTYCVVGSIEIEPGSYGTGSVQPSTFYFKESHTPGCSNGKITINQNTSFDAVNSEVYTTINGGYIKNLQLGYGGRFTRPMASGQNGDGSKQCNEITVKGGGSHISYQFGESVNDGGQNCNNVTCLNIGDQSMSTGSYLDFTARNAQTGQANNGNMTGYNFSGCKNAPCKKPGYSSIRYMNSEGSSCQ